MNNPAIAQPRIDDSGWSQEFSQQDLGTNPVKSTVDIHPDEVPVVDWSAISTNSTNSTAGASFHHPAIYPPETIIEDYMEYATNYLESADCYVLGSILAAIASILGRSVSFTPWAGPLFPNLFVMLAGKPADRKSTAIKFAEDLSRRVLDLASFLPSNFSPESLFDAYDVGSGGCPDKILIADEANILLTDWRNTGNGERNAARFLKLYDCTGDSEIFKRNIRRGGSNGGGGLDINQEGVRVIPQTSTSVIFGATFQAALFQGQSVRAGIERRFLYYIGVRHARLIELPLISREFCIPHQSPISHFIKLIGIVHHRSHLSPAFLR